MIRAFQSKLSLCELEEHLRLLSSLSEKIHRRGRHFGKHQADYVFEKVSLFHTAAMEWIMTRDSRLIDVGSQHHWRFLEEEVRPIRFDYFIHHTDVPNMPVFYRYQFND